MCAICGCVCGSCCRKRARQTEITCTGIIEITPPGIRDGVSLHGTSIDQISRNMSSILNVSIQITNFTDMYTLSNPENYSRSGYCCNPPQPTVAKKTSEVCTFTKKSYSIYGCSGVLMYKILNEKMHFVGKLAIMFSVPYDIRYENYFAFGIYDEHISCNKVLFNQMYYETGPFTRAKALGNEIKHSEKGICVSGTMSAVGTAIIKVEFRKL